MKGLPPLPALFCRGEGQLHRGPPSLTRGWDLQFLGITQETAFSLQGQVTMQLLPQQVWGGLGV